MQETPGVKFDEKLKLVKSFKGNRLLQPPTTFYNKGFLVSIVVELCQKSSRSLEHVWRKMGEEEEEKEKDKEKGRRRKSGRKRKEKR